jgi:predicted transcriptional regulator YdeE
MGKIKKQFLGRRVLLPSIQHNSGPLLERYGETFSPDNPVLSIYIPVQKKT